MVTVAMVSPGAMGSALGRGYAEAGARVVATVAGRSARTRELAAGIELLPSLEEVVAAADVVISIVPPGDALHVADQVATAAQAAGVQPLYADFNAIAPATVARIATAISPLPFVDGSISGGPPNLPGTRLYLSGRDSAAVAALAHPRLNVVELPGDVGTASAVKMSTASVYKGVSALLLQALRAAEANGVLDPVVEDLTSGYPELMHRLAPRLASSASKAHRFVGEMHEIALAQGAAGLTPDLFTAVAAVYQEVAGTALGDRTPEQARELTELLDVLRLLKPGRSR